MRYRITRVNVLATITICIISAQLGLPSCLAQTNAQYWTEEYKGLTNIDSVADSRLQQEQPNCKQGRCNEPTVLTQQPYSRTENHAAQVGTQLLLGSSAGSSVSTMRPVPVTSGEYTISSTVNNVLRRQVTLRTPTGQLPQLGLYYESDSSAGHVDAVSGFYTISSGRINYTCPQGAIRRSGFKIEKLDTANSSAVNVAVSYFLSCVSRALSNRPYLERTSVSGRFVIGNNDLATKTPIEKYAEAADLKSVSDFIVKQSNTWFKKFAEVKSYTPKQISGMLVQLEYNEGAVCGVNSVGTLYCANQNLDSNPNWFIVPGQFKHIAFNNGRLWGINYSEEIFYAANYRSANWVKLFGWLRNISADGNVICGTTSTDTIYCADQNIGSAPNWFQLPGALMQISVSNGSVFGVNRANQIYAATNYRAPNWTLIWGSLSQVSLDKGTVCGSSGGRFVYCADSNIFSNPNWTYVPVEHRHVSVHNGVMMGVTPGQYLTFYPSYKNQ